MPQQLWQMTDAVCSTGRECAAMARSERLAEQLDWYWRKKPAAAAGRSY